MIFINLVSSYVATIILMLHTMQVNIFFLASSLYKVYQGRKQQVKFTAKEQSRFEVARYKLSIKLLSLLS